MWTHILPLSVHLTSTRGYILTWYSIHHFWDTPTAFSQNTFLLRKWLSFIPRSPEIPTSRFPGVLNTMVRVLKVSVPISGFFEGIIEKMFIQFCEAQPISATSLKICTPKLQLLHNTEQRSLDMERWLTPWRTSTYERPFTQVVNYLVAILDH